MRKISRTNGVNVRQGIAQKARRTRWIIPSCARREIDGANCSQMAKQLFYCDCRCAVWIGRDQICPTKLRTFVCLGFISSRVEQRTCQRGKIPRHRHAKVHLKGQIYRMSVFKRNKITDIPSVLYKYALTVALKPRESVREATHTRFESPALQPRHGKMLRKLTCTTLLHCATTVLLSVAFLILGFLRILPCTRWIVVQLMDVITVVPMPTELYWQSLFKWQMFKAVRSSILLELQKSAQKDHAAPNPSLVSLDGVSHSRLLSFCRGNRPLVVNFCSWTCPVFRARVGEFLSVVQEFSDIADFLTIYIEEAHPSNGWAFKVSYEIFLHTILPPKSK